MMTATLPATKLTIENANNKLACDCFLHIAIAPALDKLPTLEELRSRLYYVEYNGERKYYRLMDMYFKKFKYVLDNETWVGYAMDADSWRQWYVEKYPLISPENSMVVCYYLADNEYIE